ncbi:hypothetical protein H072_3620 [Dactylellina haptotyla CBS 200.50]|uniref:Large ribosomal subunit protein mL49 n=1 Tax=Dactylellina haptotyla (strain CBS 200.50) TaxID=1284197 RepID=S8C460_DACHA|nr:hypothetical protein H072_3620 [Dactylellina haptotyla CBS 200.50]
MNVLRLPRLWASPIARPYNGSSRSIATPFPSTASKATGSVSQLWSLQSRSLSTEYPKKTESARPPPSPSSIGAQLPYQLANSKSGNLPIYVKHRKDGVKELTYIRKIKGDRKALIQDLSKELKIPVSDIRIKEPVGYLEVKGDRMAEIKKFFRSRGIGESFHVPE